jgi:hypothetical protein
VGGDVEEPVRRAGDDGQRDGDGHVSLEPTHQESSHLWGSHSSTKTYRNVDGIIINNQDV